MNKNIIGFIGFVLVIGTIIQGTEPFVRLLDWSNGELVGSNMFVLLSLIGGVFMVRYSLKRDKTESD